MTTHLLPPPENKTQPLLPRVASRSTSVPTLEQIRARAYQKYCARDGVPGDQIADWLEAERELRCAKRDPAEHPDRELKLLSDAEPSADPFC